MTETIIVIIFMEFIAICLLLAKKSKEKGNSDDILTIPEPIQISFRNFADNLLNAEEILLEEAKIISWELLSEVAYDQGTFYYYRIEYSIVPVAPVETVQGIVLNSKELFEKFGFKDQVVVLFYKENDEIYEISFIPEKRLTMKGYKAYIDTRYRNVKEWKPLDEYSLCIEDKQLTLWENIVDKPLFEDLTVTRTMAEGDFASSAQYIDVLENQDIEIHSWIQFEHKRELAFCLIAKTYKVETPRGIHVGSTVEELKEKYPLNLSFDEDLNEQGPTYGYIPEDQSNGYIGFRAKDGIINEIIITESFGERPFKPKEGYIDQDIPWVEDNYEEFLTEKYARAIYLGRHKVELDPRQVFNLYVSKNFKTTSILQKGLWREYEEGKVLVYFVIGEDLKE
ncbi:MAG: hypothetical protein AB9836_09030 [Aminipila sp.]